MKTMTTFLFMGILIIKTSFGQLTFTTDQFNKTESSRDFDSNTIVDLGMTIPINALLKKYDKIEIDLHYRSLDEDNSKLKVASYRGLTFFPHEKQFIDYFEGETKIKFYIIKPESVKALSIADNDFFESVEKYEYKISVSGYFDNGTETVWDDRNTKYKTNKLYKYSKELYVGEKFIFNPNNNVIKEQLDIEKRNNQIKEYKKLHENLTNYIYPTFGVLLTSRILALTRTSSTKSYNKSEAAIEALIKSNNESLATEIENYNTVIELESKYMEIFKAKKGKDLFMKIKNLNDFEAIKKIVLDFEI